ncbi:MAG: hypothetical protein GX614_13300 [Sandaracinaceae bacterium]|nr:hypothetical protein [Sandaracinaceae bacterium]
MIIGFIAGLVAENAGEWVAHRYLLHEQGMKKGSFWSFHFHEHHRASRLSEFRDPHYERPLFSGLHAQSKEALALAAVALPFIPLLRVAPGLSLGVLTGIANYYRVHKKSHQDPEWAKHHLPWHYDHHMGPNQHANWCVTWPLFDHVMGTREYYLGTEREKKDRARREEIAQKRAQRAAEAAQSARAGEPDLTKTPTTA